MPAWATGPACVHGAFPRSTCRLAWDAQSKCHARSDDRPATNRPTVSANAFFVTCPRRAHSSQSDPPLRAGHKECFTFALVGKTRGISSSPSSGAGYRPRGQTSALKAVDHLIAGDYVGR